jgi:DNA-binding CsgD family transcriptional regulator
MGKYEGPDHAAEYIGHLTRKPGTGVTARTPKPAREVLYSFEKENAGIATDINLRASYVGDMDRDDDTALARLMDSMLERLSPRQKQAVELVAVAGLTFGAAAKEMGTSKATLYAHYRDGIRKLRTLLTETPWAAALIGPWLTEPVDSIVEQDATGIVVPLPSLNLDKRPGKDESE